jgi:hypothetical protein
MTSKRILSDSGGLHSTAPLSSPTVEILEALGSLGSFILPMDAPASALDTSLDDVP